jgi:hypothetical protein
MLLLVLGKTTRAIVIVDREIREAREAKKNKGGKGGKDSKGRTKSLGSRRLTRGGTVRKTLCFIAGRRTIAR